MTRSNCHFPFGEIDGLMFINIISIEKNALMNIIFERFPFDWKHPKGFFLSAIITYGIAQLSIMYAAHIISFGIGLNLYVVALTEDIKRHLSVVNECIKAEKAKRSDISKQLAEYIQFHSDAIQLSDYY